MIRVLILDGETTALEDTLSNDDEVDQIIRVPSSEALLDKLAENSQAIDIAAISLLLPRPQPYRLRDRIMVELEGLTVLQEVSQQRPKLPLIAIAGDLHERTVIHACHAGARWLVRSDVTPPDDIGTTLRQLVAGEQVLPYGFDTHATNLWKAAADPRLTRCTPREVEIIELLLLGLDRPELIGRLGFANMQTYWSKMTRLLDRVGLPDVDALAAHAHALGIVPPGDPA